jgi:hypothetical protein
VISVDNLKLLLQLLCDVVIAIPILCVALTALMTLVVVVLLLGSQVGLW